MSPIQEFGKTASDLSRNPLGIIALFVVLVYGIAGLVFSASAGSLTPEERFPLILFLAIFPVCILLTFAYLVSRHHTKLYSPRDFPQEDGFLRAIQLAPPSALKEKALDEAEEIQGSVDKPHEDHPQQPKSTPASEPSSSQDERSPPKNAFISALKNPAGLASLYAIAEELVFRELERSHSSPVRRNVALGDSRFDGVVAADKPIVIEVKMIHKGLPIALERVLRRIDDSLSDYPDVRILLALVDRGDTSERFRAFVAAKVNQIASQMQHQLLVQTYLFEELNAQYGLVARPDVSVADVTKHGANPSAAHPASALSSPHEQQPVERS